MFESSNLNERIREERIREERRHALIKGALNLGVIVISALAVGASVKAHRDTKRQFNALCEEHPDKDIVFTGNGFLVIDPVEPDGTEE